MCYFHNFTSRGISCSVFPTCITKLLAVGYALLVSALQIDKERKDAQMRRKIIPFGFLLSTLILLNGCEPRLLEEGFIGTAKIPIVIYWDLAEITPKNATVMFYTEDGSFYKEWRTASGVTKAEGEVELEPGNYTVVAFNELRDQIDYVRMRGWDKLETFEAYITENLNPPYAFSNRVVKEKQVNEPGILASCMTRITVTTDMVCAPSYNTKSANTFALSDLHPDRKTAQANMKVHVKGLSNALMPAMAELRHMASSYFFATDRNSLVPVTAQFKMNNRTYESGSKKDGSISTVITTFGVLGEWYHTADTPDAAFYLDIAFMLADAGKTIVEVSTEITHLIEIVVDEKNAVTINIELDTEPLPEIKPVGNNSGFDTDLVDWDKVVIPLGKK